MPSALFGAGSDLIGEIQIFIVNYEGSSDLRSIMINADGPFLVTLRFVQIFIILMYIFSQVRRLIIYNLHFRTNRKVKLRPI